MAGTRVIAVEMGFYKGQRRRAGVIFELADPKDFRKSWMELTEDEPQATPEAKLEAQREHKNTMRGKGKKLQPNGVDVVQEVGIDPTAQAGEKSTGDQNVI